MMEVDEYPTAEADELASLEYTNLESEGLTALTRQIQVGYIVLDHEIIILTGMFNELDAYLLL